MKSFLFAYSVIGGDLRQRYLAQAFAGQPGRVCCYALCPPPGEEVSDRIPAAENASSLEEACQAENLLLPIPLCKKEPFLNQRALPAEIPLDALLTHLRPGQSLFAGCIPAWFRISAAEKGARVFDLMDDPILSAFNSLATAEGALCEAIRRSPRNLHHSRSAVLGYGTCGSTLAQYLKGLHSHVYAAVNSPEKRAKAALLADETGSIRDFSARAGEFDFVFNTVPAVIVTADILAAMKPSVIIIDIASAPGGIDCEAAEKLGLRAALCPGLPGTYAPLSSALAIQESIERILKE